MRPANADEPDRGGGQSGAEGPATNTEDETTGLPGLRTWRAVYVFVLILFAVYVVLLLALERAFA